MNVLARARRTPAHSDDADAASTPPASSARADIESDDATAPIRVELRDEARQRIGRVEVDPIERPTRVRTIDTDRDVFLTWDSAVDDAGRLRRCIACGCHDLFKVKTFPQITGFVVVAAFAGAIIGVLGLVTPPLLVGMVLVLVLDIAILLFSRQHLVCYRCRSSYYNLPIASYHKPWDRGRAETYASDADTTQPDAAAVQPASEPPASDAGRLSA